MAEWGRADRKKWSQKNSWTAQWWNEGEEKKSIRRGEFSEGGRQFEAQDKITVQGSNQWQEGQNVLDTNHSNHLEEISFPFYEINNK